MPIVPATLGLVTAYVALPRVMDGDCTDRRIGDIGMLTNEVAAWTKRRNENKKKINWKFTKKIADEKMSKFYVS
jgi:hypothetical protein